MTVSRQGRRPRTQGGPDHLPGHWPPPHTSHKQPYGATKHLRFSQHCIQLCLAYLGQPEAGEIIGMGGVVSYQLRCPQDHTDFIPNQASVSGKGQSILGVLARGFHIPQPYHPTSQSSLGAPAQPTLLTLACLLMCPGQQEAQPQGIRTHWARSNVINSQPNPGPN